MLTHPPVKPPRSAKHGSEKSAAAHSRRGPPTALSLQRAAKHFSQRRANLSRRSLPSQSFFDTPFPDVDADALIGCQVEFGDGLFGDGDDVGIACQAHDALEVAFLLVIHTKDYSVYTYL